MISLGKIFRNYTGLLRRFKLSYVVNNLLNSRYLQHNVELYPKYGLKKSIYAPIGSRDFPNPSEDIPWLDKPGAKEKLQAHQKLRAFPKEIREELFRFVDDGYMILKAFFDDDAVDRLNTDVDRLLKEQEVGFNYTGKKIMESFRHSSVANEFFRDPRLLELLGFTLGKQIIPFHTINFIEGSEQRAHSDFIHMTTEPRGYLIAAWIALEDCHDGNGPLFFYPGSHRLPFILADDFPSGNTAWMLGANPNRSYEDKIAEIIQQNGLQKKHFIAKKGDVLIWHANLIHGGEAIRDKGATRKSMVAHYFAKDVICYHEISQRPALLDI